MGPPSKGCTLTPGSVQLSVLDLLWSLKLKEQAASYEETLRAQGSYGSVTPSLAHISERLQRGPGTLTAEPLPKEKKTLCFQLMPTQVDKHSRTSKYKEHSSSTLNHLTVSTLKSLQHRNQQMSCVY
jgi:hypothetical protein